MLNMRKPFALASLLTIWMVMAVPAQADAQEWRLGVKTFSAKGGGLKISEVTPNSPAAEIGLMPGQLILALGGKLVNKPEEAREKVFAAGDEIDIIYQDGTEFLQVTAPLVSQTYTAVVAGKNVKMEKLVPKGGRPKPKRVTDPRKR